MRRHLAGLMIIQKDVLIATAHWFLLPTSAPNSELYKFNFKNMKFMGYMCIEFGVLGATPTKQLHHLVL